MLGPGDHYLKRLHIHLLTIFNFPLLRSPSRYSNTASELQSFSFWNYVFFSLVSTFPELVPILPITGQGQNHKSLKPQLASNVVPLNPPKTLCSRD